MGLSASLQGRLPEREMEERRLIADLVNLQDLLLTAKDIPHVSDQQLDEWIEKFGQH